MCLLFAKSGVELLLLTLTGNNQFWRWEAWVLVLGLIIFALMQLWYLHKALILADPTLVCPSAFCFYNLSSIMNGLVYFDQFSLIPPVHLGLVILGIFILLGGVWVVSIQSGGGGIDVGTWNEGDDFSCQEDILLPDSEDLCDTQEAGAMSMARQPTFNHRPQATERETLSESNVSNMAMSPQSVGLELDDPAQDSSLAPIPTTEIHRPPASQLSSSPEVPSQFLLRHYARRGPARQSSTSMTSGNSRTASQPHSQTTHLPPLGPVSSLGTGFQIGLSPLSPGFTIVPFDRRRRTSGTGTAGRPSLADVANDIITGLRETEGRRTTSEGELTRTVLHEVQDVSRDDGAAVREDHTERIGDCSVDETGDQLESRKRWLWIKKVFTGKD